MLWKILLLMALFLTFLLWACIVVGSRSDDRAEEMYYNASKEDAPFTTPKSKRSVSK